MDELLDLINDQNQVTGTIAKSVAHQGGLLHRIVIGEIVNPKGEYCFVQQAGDRQDAGQFVSPIGGHVGAGESIEAALMRECQEECGFTPQHFDLVGSTVFNRQVIGRHENHLFLVYQIRSDQNPILNHESVGFRWFSVPEIKSTLQSKPQLFGAAWHHVFKNIFPIIYSAT
ncbi:MAG: hypothetical protein UX62_C0063G0002 [Microgenomates group bacterium GW2011_GWA2_46_7]|nr:MAG: hypothetical protein UX62_C0063G0002 [Microgenomates group bacterium GW2011_GWA2_46_7]KKU45439.1 MAG: hypothetical protein UX64_C0029G0003 [Microgenomates group bacterium GW2011_GWC2_46_7]